MYLENLDEEVIELLEKFDMLNEKDKMDISLSIFYEWNYELINDKNETNPTLEEECTIFNTLSINVNPRLIDGVINGIFSEMCERGYIKVNSQPLVETYIDFLDYSKDTNEILSKYTKLNFKNKIDVIAELIIRYGNGEIINSDNKNYYNLPDENSAYNIASLIRDYKTDLD